MAFCFFQSTQFSSTVTHRLPPAHRVCIAVWCDHFLPSVAAGTRAAWATRARRSEKVAMRAAESSCPCDIYIPLATWSPAGAQIRRFNCRCHLRSLFAFLPFLLLKVRYTGELSRCETGTWRCLPQFFRPFEPAGRSPSFSSFSLPSFFSISVPAISATHLLPRFLPLTLFGRRSHLSPPPRPLLPHLIHLRSSLGGSAVRWNPARLTPGPQQEVGRIGL